MIDNVTAPTQDGAKRQFFLTGFSQAAGIRTYAFQGRIDATRSDYTVEVDLALIPGFGIRIQDLPLLCRELLQQRTQPDEISALVLTEQRMRSHAEKLAIARQEAEHRKKQPKHLANANANTSANANVNANAEAAPTWRTPWR
jgi:hypothetical protein